MQYETIILELLSRIKKLEDDMSELKQAMAEKNTATNLTEDVLEKDHYGLEKVKERILEYLAVYKLTGKLNGPILKGHATVGKFASGGIVAENCSSDFLMKGTNFYLTGKISQRIILPYI